ncbi:hypothetical protein MMC10_010635 [Thelotrema lepadinum]|nr:hypothetical protein [Thelotrema lepadinum]
MSSTFDPSIPDESHQSEIVAAVTVLMVAVVLTTAIRIITKLVCKFKLGWDDCFILLATAFNIVGDAFEYIATSEGFGRHIQYLTSDQKIQALKYGQLAILNAFFAMWSVKLSVCFFLLGIIRGTHKYFRIAIYSLIGLTTAASFIGCLLWGLQANPIAKLWDPSIPGTKTSPETFLVSVYVELALIVFTDLFYALSPMYFLWGVQMKLSRKIPILAMTGCGFLVVIIGIIQTVFAKAVTEADLSWDLYPFFITDIIDRHFSVFVANLPALWVLYRQSREKYTSYMRSLRSRSRKTGNSKSGYGDGTKTSNSAAYNPKKQRTNSSLDDYAGDGHYGNETNNLDTGLEYEDVVPLRGMPQHPDETLTSSPRQIHVNNNSRDGATRGIGQAVGWSDTST